MISLHQLTNISSWSAIITTTLLLFINQPVHAENSWEFNTEEDQISVFIRDVRGSDINEIKGVGIIDCTIDQVWSILRNPKYSEKLFPNVKKSKELGTCGANCTLTYTRLGASGIDDRHYISKMRWSITEKQEIRQYTMKWSKSVQEPDSKEGVIIVEKVNGFWKLRSVNNGTGTKFIHQNFISLGGSVPSVFINEGSENNIIEFFQTLRNICSEEQ